MLAIVLLYITIVRSMITYSWDVWKIQENSPNSHEILGDSGDFGGYWQADR